MGTNLNPNTRNRNMPVSLGRRRSVPHINMWVELQELEKQIVGMEKLLNQHNPAGHGFDSSFGHKGGGASGGMSGFVRTDLSMFVGDMRFDIDNDADWRMFQSGQSETQFICYNPTQADGLTATDLNRVGADTYMELATEFTFLHDDAASATAPGTYPSGMQSGLKYNPDIVVAPGTDVGRYINVFGSGGIGANGWWSADLGDLASGWTNIARTGTGTVPAAGASDHNIGWSHSAGSILMNWQVSSFMIGVYTDAINTVWDNAAFTTNSIMSNIQGSSWNSTFSVNELHDEALLLDSKNSNEFGVYELELLDVSGDVASSIEIFDPIELPGNEGNSGGQATGLYNIDDMWVIGSPHGGGVWLISLDFL